jgi:iron complex outermembrane receptor protein
MRLLAAPLLLLASVPASAQRAAENAVLEAEDAFGTSIGRETIGLYSSSSVRGFSPTRAGNVRIDGLVFDQVWGLTNRIRVSTAIRVGISAIGTPFPAPTGIVDYTLRRPADRVQLSVLTGADSYSNAYIEADASLPLSKTLSLGLGGASYMNNYYNGTTGFYLQGAAMLRWRPAPNLEIMPYFNRSEGFDDEAGPIFIPGGAFLPPPVERRRFLGPQAWGGYFGVAANAGVVGRWEPGDGWTVQAGLFRSLFDDQQSFAHLLTDVQLDRSATRIIIADPPIKVASTSGEVRLTRTFPEGPRVHRAIASVRARDNSRRTDGSDVVDFGRTTLDAPFAVPSPSFTFSEQTVDDVRQWTGGFAWQTVWPGVGELGLGLQRTDYSKAITIPDVGLTATEARPWLWNVNAAITITDRLAIYGGYVTGLEESGIAPNNASNRNEALPAIQTSQRDLGLRYAISPRLKLVAGLFDVRKPYFNLDADNRFDVLGDVRHRGVELSLAGNLASNLNIVAGAVLLDARVTGEGVTLGRVGERPVGQTGTTLQLNADWQVPGARGLSFDIGVQHEGDSVATVDNRVSIPARTLVDLGARYRTKIGGKPVTFRLTMTNVGDVQGFDLRGAGAYDIIPGRVIGGWIAVDL